MIEALSIHLKDSIAGIILLGALGSLLAVGLLRLCSTLINKVLPAPYYIHRSRRARQAFLQGWASALIEKDDTGRSLVAFFSYHIACFMLAQFLFLLSVLGFSLILALQSQIALTIGSFTSITFAFLALYWAYFEFEDIYRMYLFFWKGPLTRARDVYRGKREKRTTVDSGET